MPPGTDIDTMDAVVREFESKVLESDIEKELNARIQSEDAYLSISFPAAVESSPGHMPSRKSSSGWPRGSPASASVSSDSTPKAIIRAW